MQHTGYCIISLSLALLASAFITLCFPPLTPPPPPRTHSFDWAAPSNARAVGGASAPAFFKPEVFAGGAAEDAAGCGCRPPIARAASCLPSHCLLLLHRQLTCLTAEEDDDGNGGVGGVGRREKHKLVEQRRREKTKELLVELQQARCPEPNPFSSNKCLTHFVAAAASAHRQECHHEHGVERDGQVSS